MNPKDHAVHRKTFSRLGFSLFLLLAVTTAGQYALFFAFEQSGIALDGTSWLSYLVALGPLYLLAFPLFLLLTRSLETQPLPDQKLRPSLLLMFFVMSVPLLYGGNLLGLGLTTLLQQVFEVEATHALLEMVQDANPAVIFVFAVVLAPIIEEVIFRKVLIDKTVKYGKGLAIFLSGLFFGLFHGNFYQFFYAFALGLLFAYVYVISGRLRYVIGLHMLINFLGVIVAPALLSLVDMEAVEQAVGIEDPQILLETLGDSLVGILLLGLYALLMIGLSLTGIVLFIVRRKHFRLGKTDELESRRLKYAMAFGNIGTVLFILGCVALFSMSLLF